MRTREYDKVVDSAGVVGKFAGEWLIGVMLRAIGIHNEPDAMSLREIEDRYLISESTLRRAIKADDLKAEMRSGKLFVSRNDIERYRKLRGKD